MALDLDSLNDNNPKKVKSKEEKSKKQATAKNMASKEPKAKKEPKAPKAPREPKAPKEKKAKLDNEYKEKKSPVKLLIILGIILAIIIVSGLLAYKFVLGTVEVEKYSSLHLVINSGECTTSLKHDIFFDENNVFYLSQGDVANFYDGEIYYDSKYDMIVTASETELVTMPVNKTEITINNVKKQIKSPVIKKGQTYFIPFSEIAEDVFDTEISFIKESNVVKFVSTDRALVTGINTKNNNIVKQNPKFLSRAMDKIPANEEVTIVPTEDDSEWTKVFTARGKIGYIKTDSIKDKKTVREDKVVKKQIDGKVSLVWDYYSEYVEAPTRSGKIDGINVISPAFFYLQKDGNGVVLANVGEKGEDYLDWAHSNGYKVWPMLSNNSLRDTTSAMLNDFYSRNYLIESILYACEIYDIDGINLDFENLNLEDKDEYTKLIIELKPRLNALGKVLTVDVTAPDGSENWSLCYDRNKIGKLADYVVYMGYDQYTGSSSVAGTNSGYNWLEANINKFLKQEEVPAEKIILGLPFYTREWKDNGISISTEVVNMKSIDAVIPSGTERVWLEDERQYYAEYTEGSNTYKIWIEDDRSIREKLSLVNKYNLAGAAYWNKDREMESIWQVISEELDIE